MGFSTVSANVIFAVALVGAVGGAIATWLQLQQDVPEAQREQIARWHASTTSRATGLFCYDSALQIVHANATDLGGPVDLDRTQLLLDGTFAAWSSVWVDGAESSQSHLWRTGENVTLNVTDVPASPSTADIILPSGERAVLAKVDCPYLATVVVAPPSADMQIGGTQTFTAAGFDQWGRPWPGVIYTWSTDTGTIASVNDTAATLTAGTVSGAFTVTATTAGVNGTAAVTVWPGAPASVEISPSSADVTAGATQAFSATVLDAWGNVNSTATVAWTTDAGSITQGGVLTAQTTAASGKSVTATSGAASNSATVNIVPDAPSAIAVTPDGAGITAGSAQQFTAVVTDRYGNVNSTATVTWSTNGGSITSGGGLLTAQTTAAAGKTVTATSGAASGSATFDVIADAPASVTVTPNGAGIPAGSTQQFTAVVRDVYGNVNSTASVSWTTDAGSIGAATGLLTAQTTAANSKFVAATSGGVTGSASVDIIADAPNAVAVSPNGMGLTAGTTQQYAATVTDQYGNVNSTASVTWATNAGSVSASGLLTAQTTAASGKSVTATSGGVSGSATVDIIAAAPSSITVTPNGAGITAGTTQQYTAVAYDQYGNVNSTATVTWSTNAGSITTGGLLTAQTTAATGKSVTATSGVSGSGTVDIIADAPNSVTVSPAVVGVPAGGTQAFTATVLDQYGNVNSTATVTWSTNTGSITSGGVLTAPTVPASGKTVTATSGGHSGTASVTIYPAAPASVSVSPTSAIVNTTLTQQFTATATDQYGNVNSTATISWSATRGSVSASGLYTAPGTTGADTVTASTNGHSSSASVTVQKAIHIASIATFKNNASAGSFAHGSDTVDARVTIVDHLGNGVGSVSVTLEWHRPNSNLDHTDSLTSVANGTANAYMLASTPAGSWSVKVTSLSGTDLWWNSAADVQTTQAFTVT